MKKHWECDTIENVSDRKIAKILWYAAVAMLGGVYYVVLEILWRGYSHWTMVLVGGGAILCMYAVFGSLRAPFLVKCCVAALSVCVLEFFSGCIINLWLGLDVWDYSQLKFNLLGQVCPLFFGVWFVLSIPAAYVCRIVQGLENHFVSGGIRRGGK